VREGQGENFVEGHLWKVGVLWTNWRCKVGETWMGGMFLEAVTDNKRWKRFECSTRGGWVWNPPPSSFAAHRVRTMSHYYMSYNLSCLWTWSARISYVRTTSTSLTIVEGSSG
jgi:hypothetical protein